MSLMAAALIGQVGAQIMGQQTQANAMVAQARMQQQTARTQLLNQRTQMLLSYNLENKALRIEARAIRRDFQFRMQQQQDSHVETMQGLKNDYQARMAEATPRYHYPQQASYLYQDQGPDGNRAAAQFS